VLLVVYLLPNLAFFDQMKRFLGLFQKFNPTFALFSATIQNAVEEVLTQYLDDCIRIEVGGNNKVLTKIDQSIEYCTN
jgi:superfamily II DNA/RNA helicase